MSHNRHSSLNFVTQLHQKQKTKSLKNKNTTREAGKTIAYVAPFPSAKHTHCAAACKKAYTCVCGEQTLCIFVDHFNCRSDRRHIRLHNDNGSPEDQTRRWCDDDGQWNHTGRNCIGWSVWTSTGPTHTPGQSMATSNGISTSWFGYSIGALHWCVRLRLHHHHGRTTRTLNAATANRVTHWYTISVWISHVSGTVLATITE